MSKYFSLHSYDIEAIVGILQFLAFVIDNHLELPQDIEEFRLYDEDEVVKKAKEVLKHFGSTIRVFNELKEILRE